MKEGSSGIRLMKKACAEYTFKGVFARVRQFCLAVGSSQSKLERSISSLKDAGVVSGNTLGFHETTKEGSAIDNATQFYTEGARASPVHAVRLLCGYIAGVVCGDAILQPQLALALRYVIQQISNAVPQIGHVSFILGVHGAATRRVCDNTRTGEQQEAQAGGVCGCVGRDRGGRTRRLPYLDFTMVSKSALDNSGMNLSSPKLR